MTTIKEAVPTEYQGVKFRSKSEAVFARSLDLAGLPWEYEPQQWTTADGWTPDFWVIFKGRRGFLSAFIEYKPARPTNSYFELLERRCVELAGKLEGHTEIIMWGSPFDASAPRGMKWKTTEGWFEAGAESPWMHMLIYWNDAKSFRFDLAQHE